MELSAEITAHGREARDLSYSGHSSQVVATVGADGATNIFDFRDLHKSLTLYKDTINKVLSSVHCNQLDDTKLAIVPKENQSVLILDTRKPGKVIDTLTCSKIVS